VVHRWQYIPGVDAARESRYPSGFGSSFGRGYGRPVDRKENGKEAYTPQAVLTHWESSP
jgi:hypothetical protein